jgi:SKI/SNO/DAC family/c-SKI Smad4 binding domain
MIQSRSPSPAESVVNAPNSNINTPKPNQVRTSLRKLLISPIKVKNHFGSSKQVGMVTLYGIPIVSLYIESQERLCLAQISNTLLKQFSYNEIHNRRVALGITCVQCTPVQLEILRRANAMPVSSRRCGMITRREAERLCKSFLGDNSPPRLPDDFSFAVFHECAWGCRGSFLPSRYNSSRAKCIKCTFCGLFFSPNKFIFHSHRVSANDKYVQPDAANFNSWRRHLRLSGTPPDDVAHAWEDVKAMFNGGTRKRLMSSPITPIRESNPSNSSSSSATKKPKESPAVSTLNGQPQVAQYPIRPANINHPYSSNTTNSQPSSIVNSIAPITAPNPQTLRVPNSFPQELPFSLSRSFMIDYMWHHQQQNTTSVNAPTATNKHFQFPPYSALNWIKQPPPSFLFKPNNGTSSINPSNDEKPPTFNHFHSAFKPVINMRLNDETNANVTSIVNPNTQSPTSSTSSNYNHTTASSTNQSDDETPKKLMNRKRLTKSKEVDYFVDVDENSRHGEHKICIASESGDGFDGNNTKDKDQMTSDDENEMVDIETTEDDIQILNLQPFKVTHHHHSGMGEIENEEEIEVTDEKFTQLENNNNLKSSYEQDLKIVKQPKSPIKSLKEIVNRGDRESEDYFSKRNRTSPQYNEWTLNLKKEVRK